MHQIQQKIIEIYKENNNSLPSFRALAKELGVASLNTVAYHINQLKKNGYLKETLNASGVMPLNLRNILNLASKPGVYIILNDKTPLRIEEADDIKKSILKIIDAETPLDKDTLKTIKNDLEKITIAYYIIESMEERKKTKEYVVGVYRKNE
ncbi:MAG: winged helix-turn-helix domain-containing protein [Patescibacteria group bacterium]